MSEERILLTKRDREREIIVFPVKYIGKDHPLAPKTYIFQKLHGIAGPR